MAALLHFPILTRPQRESLHLIDSLARDFGLSPRQRQAAKTAALRETAQGRSNAVAVAEARKVIHAKQHSSTNSGDAA